MKGEMVQRVRAGLAINCAPAGTNTDNTLVVRSLAGNADVASQTRRVHVEVTS